VSLYAAKCYWPGITADEFKRDAAVRLAQIGPHTAGPDYLGSILFNHDDLVLCLFQSSSRAAVRRAAEQVAIPCERIMESVWLPGTARQVGGRPAFSLGRLLRTFRRKASATAQAAPPPAAPTRVGDAT
jgi:hypothetical protein